jgi:hypothetical protein
MKWKLLAIGLISVACLIFVFVRFTRKSIDPPAVYSGTFWRYQCVDTMKISRDRAREMITRSDVVRIVTDEVNKISELGANCIAVGTPYDEEFIPYLQLWVTSARQKNLVVWFRGNWSGWEGWFSYPSTLTPREHLQKTREFITVHKDLFVDGDIFTSAPEAENGAYFKNNVFSRQTEFRSFLVSSNTNAQEAFKGINKQVITHWSSLSGGVAKGVLDTESIGGLQGTVTIDHYVKDPREMAEFVHHFADTYKARVVFGEFGAPIPDLNGSMSELEQAAFVQKLLRSLYQDRTSIEGVNYWTLSDSSTEIVTQSGDFRSVAEVLKNYYQPGFLYGTIRNSAGDLLENVRVTDQTQQTLGISLGDGDYAFPYPAGMSELVFEGDGYKPFSVRVSLVRSTKIQNDVFLEPKNKDWLYLLREFLYKTLY